MTQPNLYDCGAFALANATAIVHKVNPCLCEWDVAKLRSHLLFCLEAGKLTPFPHKLRKVSFGGKIIKGINEKIYCVCRMPNDRKLAMILCKSCREWYHGDCVGVDVEEYHKNSMEWVCKNCTQLY